MNFKLRFALLFTLFVAVILVISSGTVYLLFYTYRESEFFERIKNKGLEFHNIISNDSSQLNLHSPFFQNMLRTSNSFDEKVTLLNARGRIIYQVPDTMQPAVTPEVLRQIESSGDYHWYNANNRQHIGMVMKGSGNILLASGYDQLGFKRLHGLKVIMLVVLLGALLVTAFVSFLFVREAFIPLRRLSIQMRQTTLQNLSQRLPQGEGEDEISDIARNFNAMLDRLTAAFEFQKSFVFHASHEFRTPLATMLSETESALDRDDMTAQEYRKLLFSLKEEQQELIELTNSLLMISQTDEINYTKDWPQLRIDEVLYDTISQAKKMFLNIAIDLVFGSMPDNSEGLVIKGNESLLRSVFMNLIKNAYMYSIDKKVLITLESVGDTILVHFDNAGMQLPADEKENILTPFFRGGNALKTKGYGLGLSIVYRFISIHKGTIIYTPVANDVNRFTITLSRASVGTA